MPYTLTIGLLWFGAAFAIGLVTGVLLRSVVARRQIAAVRAAVARDVERRPSPETVDAEPRAQTGRAGDEQAGDEEAGRAGDEQGGDEQGGDGPPTGAVARDDLTAVEGLGPAVAELCHGIGITTWRELADTEVSLLRTMLDDAGPRYRVHDPTTWPAQAELLDAGRWDELDELVAALRSGGTAT